MRHSYRRRLRAIRIALVENQWLLPLLGAMTGAVLAFALSDFDREPDPDEWAITVDRARDTMMSILGILFAGLAIVLSPATMTAQTVASTPVDERTKRDISEMLSLEPSECLHAATVPQGYGS